MATATSKNDGQCAAFSRATEEKGFCMEQEGHPSVNRNIKKKIAFQKPKKKE